MALPRTSRLAASALAVALGVAAAPFAASAAPYAFASNQISGLTLTYESGAQLTGVISATTSISSSANYGGSASGPYAAAGTVGSALDVQQAFAGPGPVTGENVFTPAGAPGTFTGARADAAIGAGTAGTGGVSVSNVAEGYGPSSAPGTFGTSTAVNSAGITFQVTGTGQAVQLSFSNLIQLVASTDAAVGESAIARIANTFSIYDATGALVAEYAPTEINQQVGSGAGVPASATVGPTSLSFTLTTPTLADGQLYTLSLTSSATESIRVGSTTPVPEPASLALLGAALLGFGAVRSRRR